jgi:hypothetical protein
MQDAHNLTGPAAELRAHLLANSNLGHAAAVSQAIANEVIERVNEFMDTRTIGAGTAMLAHALIANALLQNAGEWWAMSEDGRAIAPVTIAVLRSFTTDLPPALTGESYIPEEEG